MKVQIKSFKLGPSCWVGLSLCMITPYLKFVRPFVFVVSCMDRIICCISGIAQWSERQTKSGGRGFESSSKRPVQFLFTTTSFLKADR